MPALYDTNTELAKANYLIGDFDKILESSVKLSVERQTHISGKNLQQESWLQLQDTYKHLMIKCHKKLLK